MRPARSGSRASSSTPLRTGCGCCSSARARRRPAASRPSTGCAGTGGTLEEDGAPLTIALPDCDWRLTGLELWQGELLALKTQFPGERYELIAIDPDSGASRTVVELTELLRAVRREGWHNNVEGVAVTPDGTLWLVSDNAWTLVVDDPEPPKSHEKTLLLRIPPASSRR